jgi:hypothetical protein
MTERSKTLLEPVHFREKSSPPHETRLNAVAGHLRSLKLFQRKCLIGVLAHVY